eukprot:Sdes_comp10210_c0_seq1m1830
MSLGKLASSSDCINLWQLSHQEPVKKFTPHQGQINCVRWNHNNQVLASVGSDGYIQLSHSSGVLLGSFQSMAGSEPEILSSVAFSSGSRYLLSGGSFCQAKLWDLKKKKLLKELPSQKGPISSLCFNNNDSAFASGDLSGTIVIYSLSQNSVLHTLSAPEADPIKALEYSPFKKSLLASVDDAGSISLWDANQATLVSRFVKEHRGPCTGLAFSPYNQLLLCTIGLDKRILFIDISEKKVVKCLPVVSAPSCVSFKDDGVTVAIGTVRGAILVYDLRQQQKPIAEFNAHEPHAVTSVAFQTADKKKPANAPHFSEIPAVAEEKIMDVSSVKPSALSSEDACIFSPLKSPSTGTLGDYTPHSSATHSDSKHVLKDVGNFTPILSLFQSRIPSSSAETFNSLYESTMMSAESSPFPSLSTSAISQQKDKENERASVPDVDTPSIQPSNHISPASSHLNVESLATLPGFCESAKENNLFPDTNGEKLIGSNTDSFQMSHLKGIVEDCLDDFRSNVHRDIQNIHIEMLRQFEIQKVEFREMLKFYSVNEALVKELELLKEENRRLKLKL